MSAVQYRENFLGSDHLLLVGLELEAWSLRLEAWGLWLHHSSLDFRPSSLGHWLLAGLKLEALSLRLEAWRLSFQLVQWFLVSGRWHSALAPRFLVTEFLVRFEFEYSPCFRLLRVFLVANWGEEVQLFALERYSLLVGLELEAWGLWLQLVQWFLVLGFWSLDSDHSFLGPRH